MIEAILLGIAAGLISSFLTGPVFFSMIKTSIEKGFKAGLSLAVGVILSDIILIGIVLFGSQFFAYKADFDKYIGLIGGVFLSGVGVYYLLNTVKIQYDPNNMPKVNKRGYLIKGFLMCILTPSTLMFWLIVTSIISVKLNDSFNQKFISLVIAMGTQLNVDALKCYSASKIRYKIKENSLQKLNKIAGFIILLFAIWLLIKTYITFYQ